MAPGERVLPLRAMGRPLTTRGTIRSVSGAFALSALAFLGCSLPDEPNSDGVHSQAYGDGVLVGYLTTLMLVIVAAVIGYWVLRRRQRRK
jgi:hypothetical protein